MAQRSALSQARAAPASPDLQPAIPASPPLQPPSQESPPLQPPRSVPNDSFDPQFLTQESIDAYLAYAGSETYDPRYSFFTKCPDWSEGKDRYPLALCEFLAYKSVLSYKDDKYIHDHFEKANWRGINRDYYVFFDTGKDGDTQGFGFITGDTAFLIMRGSASLTDWKNDLTQKLTTDLDVSQEDLERIGGAGPERHLGFAKAWACVSPQIEVWLRSLPSTVKHVCLSGHSLGGALAIIGAHDLTRRGVFPVSAVVTFAAPKVGGEAFVKEYEDRLGLKDRTLRCESPEDLVTWFSPHLTFRSPGHSWPVDKRPMIKGMERLLAGLLFIAGWERTQKPTQSQPELPPKTDHSPKNSPDAGGHPESTGGGAESKSPVTDGQTGSAPAPAKPQAKDTVSKPEDVAKLVAILIGTVIFVVVFLIGRKIVIRFRAHGVERRYALYYSTLAYKKIRDLRIDNPETATDADYEKAAADFETHLRHIRGGDESPFLALKDRPIRIRKKSMAERYANETRPEGPYKQYFY